MGARNNGHDSILLGDLDSNNTVGRLAVLQLDSSQFSAIERSITSLGSLADPQPQLPEGVAKNQSLDAFVLGGSPDLTTLRTIAAYVSSHITAVPEDGLSRLLTRWTLDDVTRAHSDSAQGSVKRDPRLAEELKKVVQARRIVFINGGTKSGLSEFLEQFRNALTANAQAGAHLSADFDPNTFEDIVKILSNNEVLNGMLVRRGGDPEIAGLLMTLAYDAYTQLRASPRVDLKLLASLVPSRATAFREEFAFSYLRDFAAYADSTDHSGRSHSQVEPFLVFVGKLMASAEGGGALTIILSFPRLTNWLYETRGDALAERVGRSLWEGVRNLRRRQL